MARIEAKELPALLRAIEVYEGRQLTRLAMKMMALTFVRTSELIGARWEEFDVEAKRWSIPADRMKMKTPHIVPLSVQAIEALELLQTISGNDDLVFPGEQGKTKPDEQYDHLKGTGTNGIQGTNDGSWLPRHCVNDPAQTGLQP
jgi:integrase